MKVNFVRRDSFPKLPSWLHIPFLIIVFFLLTYTIANKLWHDYLQQRITKPRNNMLVNFFLGASNFAFVWLLVLSVIRGFYGTNDIFAKGSDGNDKAIHSRTVQHVLDVAGVIALSFAKMAVVTAFFRFPVDMCKKIGLWIWVLLSVAYDLSIIQLYYWSYLHGKNPAIPYQSALWTGFFFQYQLWVPINIVALTIGGLCLLAPTIDQFKRLVRRSGYIALHVVLLVLWHLLRVQFLYNASTTTGLNGSKLLVTDFLQVAAAYSAISAAVELSKLPGAVGWRWRKALMRLFRRRRNEVQGQQLDDIELAPAFAWSTAISAPGTEHYRAWVEVGGADAARPPSDHGIWVQTTWEVVSEPKEVVEARDREERERARI